MANTYEAVLHSVFLNILCDMMSPLERDADGFRWTIRSVSMFPEGPSAMFDCQWPEPQAHRITTASLRTNKDGRPGRHFSCTPETCALGPYTTNALAALTKRFDAALARQVVG